LFYLINKSLLKRFKISTLPFLLPDTLSLKFEAISLVNTIVFWVNNMYDEQAEKQLEWQRKAWHKYKDKYRPATALENR